MARSTYVTGWTARGFPKLTGFAWYRLRIHVADSPGPLWLKMPDHTDDSYQIFANGQYIGEFGRFTPSGVVNYRSRPLTFALPNADEHGDVLLAIRFYMEPFVLVSGSGADSGGMHQVPLVGLHAPIEDVRAQEVTGRILNVITAVFVSFLLLIAAAGAFWIWLIDRPRRTYLWLTLALVLTAAPTAVLTTAYFSYAITQGGANALLQPFIVLGLVFWILFWRTWFQLGRSRRLDFALAALAALSIFTETSTVFSLHAAPSRILFFLELKAACNAALGFLLFVPLFQGARKDRVGVFVATPPVILLTISLFTVELGDWFRIRTSFFPFGIQVGVTEVALLLLVLVTGALVARRFVTSQVAQRLERQTIDQDLEHASELQQRVLVPEPIDSDVFTVDTAYYPARTVGGDFFQIIPYPDGSLLIIVGDVSGKGIGAAMLVAVLVGTARTAAESTTDPAHLLFCLNDRMIGRAGEHFATCIAAHITTDGTMRIANAGHIPPYRNGIALDLPGAIPLGIVPGTRYDVATLQLNPGDHLTFLTDGVPEARNDAGDLLGFDGTASLSSLPPEAIAKAASAHGQDDDITIVSVRYHPPA